MKRVLWFRRNDQQEWLRVQSPRGTYGVWGSLEAYQKHLESRGMQTKVTEE